MRRRVKVTGIGPVTPAGVGREGFWAGINEPVSRVVELKKIAMNEMRFIGAAIEDWNLQAWIPEGHRTKKYVPRQNQFALAGLALALADAGLEREEVDGMEPVIISGSAILDSDLARRAYVNVATKGPRFALPSMIFDAPPYSAAARMSEFLGTRCRSISLQTACCAGLDALGQGYEMIAGGLCDIAFCCGTDAPLLRQPMLELTLMRLSPRNATVPSEMGRPFDLFRNTGVIGEGASVLVLESEDSPRQAQAWIEGYAAGDDEPGGPAANGLELTMRMALANACMRPEDITFINAWGPGHLEIDRVEAAALCSVFGDALPRIPAASLKGAIGNPFAAAGAIQAAATVLSLQTGRIPPTVNWVRPDPECPLNLGRGPRDIGCASAIVNSHGLTGTNGTLVLTRA